MKKFIESKLELVNGSYYLEVIKRGKKYSLRIDNNFSEYGKILMKLRSNSYIYFKELKKESPFQPYIEYELYITPKNFKEHLGDWFKVDSGFYSPLSVYDYVDGKVLYNGIYHNTIIGNTKETIFEFYLDNMKEKLSYTEVKEFI